MSKIEPTDWNTINKVFDEPITVDGQIYQTRVEWTRDLGESVQVSVTLNPVYHIPLDELHPFDQMYHRFLGEPYKTVVGEGVSVPNFRYSVGSDLFGFVADLDAAVRSEYNVETQKQDTIEALGVDTAMKVFEQAHMDLEGKIFLRRNA